MSRPITLAVMLAAGWPRTAASQENEAIQIAYGETVTNYLTQQDDTLQDGSAYKPYYFEGMRGDSVTIFLSSREFNAHLILTDSLDSVLNNDDNGGGMCNAYLSYVLPAGGQYVIYANAAARAETGQFQLTLQRGIQPPASRSPCAGFTSPEGYVRVGSTTTGTLDRNDRMLPDTSYFEVWTLTGAEGRTVTVDLTSSQFDPRLILIRGFDQVVAVDDDGGGGCDARLVITQEDRTPLRLVVVARPARGTGTYSLTVTEGAKPMVAGTPCTPPGDGPDDGGA